MLGRTELAAERAPTAQCGYILGTFHGPWFSDKALYSSAVSQLNSADCKRRWHLGDKRAKRAWIQFVNLDLDGAAVATMNQRWLGW